MISNLGILWKVTFNQLNQFISFNQIQLGGGSRTYQGGAVNRKDKGAWILNIFDGEACVPSATPLDPTMVNAQYFWSQGWTHRTKQ